MMRVMPKHSGALEARREGIEAGARPRACLEDYDEIWRGPQRGEPATAVTAPGRYPATAVTAPGRYMRRVPLMRPFRWRSAGGLLAPVWGPWPQIGAALRAGLAPGGGKAGLDA